MPAAVAKDCQKCSPSCGSNGGVPRGTGSNGPGTRIRTPRRAGPTGRGPPRPAPRPTAAASRRSGGRRPCRPAPRAAPRRARWRRPRPCGGCRRRGRRTACTVRSKPPCLPSWLTMWSKNGMPVSTVARPDAVEVERRRRSSSPCVRARVTVRGAVFIRGPPRGPTGSGVLVGGADGDPQAVPSRRGHAVAVRGRARERSSSPCHTSSPDRPRGRNSTKLASDGQRLDRLGRQAATIRSRSPTSAATRSSIAAV